MDYISVKSPGEIRTFFEKTNSLHDGYLLSVDYSNNGISRNKNGSLTVDPYNNELILKIMVTSLWDITVELKFTGIVEYQLKESYCNYIYCVDINVDENGVIIWSDEKWNSCDPAKMSFVKALKMEWRILNYVN